MSRINPRHDDEERELRLAIMRLERKDLLWRQHHIPDSDTPVAADVAPSTYYAIRATGGGPPRFKLGRRYYVRTSDLRRWLDQQPISAAVDNDEDDTHGQTANSSALALPDFR